MTTLKLAGRKALVTGADSGMGQAIAEEFAAEGADLTVTYRSDRQGIEETARRVEAKGARALALHLDVRDEAAVAAAFDAAEAMFGPVDILVNNAGQGQEGTPVAEMTADQFDGIIRTNLHGPFFCCREFVRRRRDGAPGAKIINITSVHEKIPSPSAAAYGASKGGLLTFTRSLALELAPRRINVNAIAPGMIETPMTARIEDPEERAKELPNIPFGRPGRPWEIARLALYLASGDSDYVTGQSFTVDGGLEMNWGQGA